MKKTNYFQGFDKIIFNSYIITNLLNRAKIKNIEVVIGSKIYDSYIISDGEKPETIAEKYYGSTSYFWIVLFANNIKNIYEEWPKSQEVFDKYVIEKYKSVEYAKTNIHHFEDEDGFHITQDSWNGLDKTKISVYDYEMKINEDKRIINLIRPEYKNQIVREFQNFFK